MTEIIKEILKHLPENKISDAVFEGANIVLYTKDKDFFLDNRPVCHPGDREGRSGDQVHNA